MKLLFCTFFIVFILGCDDSLQGKFKASISQADPSGKLDTDFSEDGVVTLDSSASGSSDDGGKAVAIDSENRIVVTGYSTNLSGNKDMVVWRFLSDGTLDSTFGTGGAFVQDNAAGGNGDDVGFSVVVASDDSIYVSGYSENASNIDELAIWKFTESGVLDTSFNSTGYLTYVHISSGASEGERGRKIIIDSQDRVVVLGQGYYTSDKSIKIWRYLSDGTLDTSFSGDGIFEDHGAAGGTGADKLIWGTIAEDGSIFGAGYSWSGSSVTNHDAVAIKVTSTGDLSTDFNSTGIATHNAAAGADGADLAYTGFLDLNERFIIAGKSTNASTDVEAAVWCYAADGALDSGFNGDGIFTLDGIAGATGSDIINGSALSDNGSYFFAGKAYNGTDHEMFVFKLSDEGELDTQFSEDGILVYQSGAGSDLAEDLAFDNNGKLIVVGEISNGVDSDLAIWRFE
tara:strand:+ start:32410 stop:33780 length:1371 start_codon:yes stop_codon:yes gene_type:complete